MVRCRDSVLRMRRVIFALVLGGTVALGGGGNGPPLAAPPAGAGWLGEDFPLPLPVRTPQDLAVKSIAERQYLIFNLLAGGKVAWDAGDFITAATKWEALLRVQGLSPEIDKVIRPLARDARAKAGGQPAAPVAASPAAAPQGTVPETEDAAAAPPRTAGSRPSATPLVTVSGTVSGGGLLGPGGAVVWLKRVGGDTPRPAPARGKVVSQRNKTFIPRVLAVPVGSKVDFRNEDGIFHNVFSLSRPNDFDTGLYRQGTSYSQVFKKAGPVQLLCNIHSSMIGYVFVVDSPYYAQADAGGAFTVKGVPPGDYEIEVWHEGSSKNTRQKLSVAADGARVSLRIGGDRRAPAFVPDKSGKPRQSHLSY
jgi:plastocyanin